MDNHLTANNAVTANPKANFWAMDGLRGMAALFVLLLHWFDGNAHVWFQYSRLAVDLFFLLSGFVIACAYDEKLKSGTSLSAYFSARLIRLYPLFLLGALLGALRFIAESLADPSPEMSIEVIFSRLILNILAIPMPGFSLEDQMYPLNIPAWSLFFEFIAYGLYGFVFRYVTRNIWLMISVFMGAIGTAGWVMVEYAEGEKDSVWPGAFHTFFIAGLFRTLFSFCLGVLLWRYRDRFAFVSGKWFLWLVLIIAVVFAAPKHAIPLPLLLILVAVVFPLTLISAMKTRVSKAQEWLYRHLGDLSYPLYITHVPFFWLAAGALKILFPEIPAVWFGLIILPASIVFAYAAFYLYDKPLRALLRRRLLPKGFERTAHGH